MSERRLSKRSSAIEKRKVLEDKLEKRRIAKERRSRSVTLPVQQQEEAASADISNENLLVDPVHSSRESLEWDSSVGEIPSFVVASLSKRPKHPESFLTTSLTPRPPSGVFSLINPIFLWLWKPKTTPNK